MHVQTAVRYCRQVILFRITGVRQYDERERNDDDGPCDGDKKKKKAGKAARAIGEVEVAVGEKAADVRRVAHGSTDGGRAGHTGGG